MKARIKELVRLKKSGEEHDMKTVDNELMTYAHSFFDYYKNSIGSFHPELVKTDSGVLDSLLYDMANA